MLGVSETPDELTIAIETTVEVVGCGSCGTRAESQDRMSVELRDLACFGRPARLVWRKRRWRCRDSDCDTKTWTERSPQVSARVLLTQRAGAEACRQVGECARPVSVLATELGVCWWTVMGAVIEHGTPLVDDRRPGRSCAPTGGGRDGVAGRQPSPSDPLRHWPGRPRRPRPRRHGGGQRCR